MVLWAYKENYTGHAVAQPSYADYTGRWAYEIAAKVKPRGEQVLVDRQH